MMENNLLQQINSDLPEGWEACLNPEGRIYYIDHNTETSSWIPPRENWDPGTICFPFGWEVAVDKNDQTYFINHVEKYTTRDDPRDDPDYIEPPKPREVELFRDPQKGFGFVAGSEKPVIVRFVTEGGPSVGKLLPGDQIIKINNRDVKKAPREEVINLVRSCKQSICLTVCQPYPDNSTRKSALLTAAKKAKLKNNPSRVRFAESVIVNGAPVQNSSLESYVPFMPNVLKVFLENGQTKSFKYDSKTAIEDVLNSLQEKMNIKCIEHFSLVLQNMNHVPGKMTLLQGHESLAEIASRPGARHFRCLFRVTFVPCDAYDLLKEDPVAFEYFYMQCCNDVTHERFSSELKIETILRLAALQIQQHAMSKNLSGKTTLKTVEKETGLDRFVPQSLQEGMKGKELRKMLSHYMKINQNLTAPGQKQLTALQAKLHYMKIISELKMFGSRVFMVTLLDKKTEAMILVGPKAGISLVTNFRSYTLSLLADFHQIQGIKIMKVKDDMQRVELTINNGEEANLSLGLLREDAWNFVSIVEGYYRIMVNNIDSLLEKPASKQTTDPDVPPYENKHRVVAAPWSYPEDIVSHFIDSDSEGPSTDNEHSVDLSWGPPPYRENEDYIAKLKLDLGIPGQNASGKTPIEEPYVRTPPAQSSNSVTVTVITKNKVANGEIDRTKKQDRRMEVQEINTKDLESKMNSDMVSEHSVFQSNISAKSKVEKDEISANERSGVQQLQNKHEKQNGVKMNGHVQQMSGKEVVALVNKDKTDALQNGPLHVIPSDLDFKDSAISFGLHSPDQIPAEIYKALHKQNLLDSKNLCQDQDLIDLTLIPPPETPDERDAVDFSIIEGMPPPGFSDEGPHTVSLPSSPAKQPITRRIGGRTLVKPDDRKSMIGNINQSASLNPNEPPPGQSEIAPPNAHYPLAKSASVGHCPDFLDSDIDAFIAKMSVPPPPVTTKEKHMNRNPASLSWNGTTFGSHLQDSSDLSNSDVSDLFGDETFSSLVIPPPPGDSSSSLDDIPIVPPISSMEEDQKKAKKVKKHSSSMEVLDWRSDSSSRLPEASKDSFANVPKSGMFYSKIKHATLPKSFSSQFPVSVFNTDFMKDVESPATVSEKLNSLLKSMQDCENIKSDEPAVSRTTSLRLKRSTSSDIGSVKSVASESGATRVSDRSTAKTNSEERVSDSSGQTTPSPVHSNHGPQVSGHYSRHLRRVQSDETILTKSSDVVENPASKAAGETLSALKAKLQSYRDRLLNRSGSLHKYDKRSEVLDTRQGLDMSHLHRSNSFSLGVDLMQGKGSSMLGNNPVSLKETFRSASDQQLVSSSVKEIPGQRTSTSVGSLNDKRSPMMWNTLAMPRSSFRPVTSNQPQEADGAWCDSDQVRSKRMGPIKALKQDINSEGKRKAKSPAPKPPLRSAESADMERRNKVTQDDILFSSDERSHTKVEAKPFSTLNKMWRPMSMSTSSVSDAHSEEVYRSFNNFDVLKGMAAGKVGTKGENLHTKATDVTINGDIEPSSVSDDSMALLSARVSEKHSNSVKRILSQNYGLNNFGQATNDVEQLLLELKQTMESLRSSGIDRRPKQFNICKCELENQVRQFVTDAKFLVSNATQTKPKLASCLDSAIHTLAKIFLHSQATMLMMEAIYQAQHVGFEVIKVANAFKSTLNAAHAAVGHPLGDPHMKYLMRQATNLAALISNLLKSLKSLEQK